MQVILKEDILNLGYKDDVVTVKSGYGRNYLISQGKAVIATPSALKMLAENMKQRAHKLEKIKNDAKELAAKLEGVSLTIGAKTSSTGKIFGSVNNIQIAEALEKAGYEVDRKVIFIKESVASLALHSCQKRRIALNNTMDEIMITPAHSCSPGSAINTSRNKDMMASPVRTPMKGLINVLTNSINGFFFCSWMTSFLP